MIFNFIPAPSTFMHKKVHGLSPTILGEVFKVSETIPYDLRMHNELNARNAKAVRYCTELYSFSLQKFGF